MRSAINPFSETRHAIRTFFRLSYFPPPWILGFDASRTGIDSLVVPVPVALNPTTCLPAWSTGATLTGS